MAQFMEIHWTCGSIDEARKISRYLVQERLVAKVQITPWIETIYMLNNQLETTQETKVVLLTEESRFDQIKEVIEKNNRYQVPEITVHRIENLNEAFREWLKETTSIS